jgi:prepilin-type N-terminal cleavage/methylation domain-containing protein
VRGFTLIEMMIILAIMGVALVSYAELIPLSAQRHAELSRLVFANASLVRLRAHVARDLAPVGAGRATVEQSSGVGRTETLMEVRFAAGGRVGYEVRPPDVDVFRVDRSARRTIRFEGVTMQVVPPRGPSDRRWLVALSAPALRGAMVLVGGGHPSAGSAPAPATPVTPVPWRSR